MGKRIKNKVVSFRVTPEVSDQIHAKADAAGESLAAFLTDAALGKEIVNLNELTAFTKELKRHGTNLNQLAVLAHTGKIQCPDIGEALKLYEQLLGLLKKKTERRPD
jgi:hypothetical protein